MLMCVRLMQATVIFTECELETDICIAEKCRPEPGIEPLIDVRALYH